MQSLELSRRMLGRSALASAATAAVPPGGEGMRNRVSAILPSLVAMVQDGMAPWQVPGAAVGVVLGEDVLLAHGLGVRRAGGSDPVDADTVFQIGSTTKAFAATTEAILVDQGKLDWMDRVIDHDPAFELFDPWVTREFRIIDLLAQRSGLRPYAFDSLWMLGYGPDDLVAALRHAKPVSSFRTTFSYQNVTQQVAGRIVAKLAGVARWQDAVSRMILEPLGMSATTTSAEGLLGVPNHAEGHIFYDNMLRALPLLPSLYGAGPAGGINSCVNDMVSWLRLLIGRGETGGRRLLGAAALEATWKPRVELDPADSFPWVWQAYASGWIVRQTERGVAIWHNGGTGQFKTHVGFVPSLGVGLVILTNEGSNALADATGLWFYDRLLGNKEVDYGAQYLATVRQAAAKEAAENRRPAPPAPPGPGGDYAGAYASDVTGPAKVAAEGGGALTLSFERPGTSFRLLPWDGDVFVLTSADPVLAATLDASSPEFVQFQRTVHGKVDRVRLGDGQEVELAREAG
jgi:CubicO group peptidase (beta-lactamase class C family)